MNRIPDSKRQQNTRAFSLIEMIGVLAVVAVLAALVVPKAFNALSDSRMNNVAVGIETVKAAVTDHYAKYLSILVDGTTTPPTTLTTTHRFDLVLLKEGFLDKPFRVRIGDGINDSSHTRIEAVNFYAPVGNPVQAADGTIGTADTSGFALAGGTTNSISSDVLVEAVITGVNESDAQDLSQRIDGPSMSTTVLGRNDYKGRVKYRAGTPTTVYVYLGHE
jgi:prepilin-type N-terminal cleavage/methylation domain-containing protein